MGGGGEAREEEKEERRERRRRTARRREVEEKRNERDAERSDGARGRIGRRGRARGLAEPGATRGAAAAAATPFHGAWEQLLLPLQTQRGHTDGHAVPSPSAAGRLLTHLPDVEKSAEDLMASIQ